MKKVFISYSHKDEDWKNRLVTHLGVLEKQGFLEIWDDRRIHGGEDWYEEIEKALESASVAILMISANFLTSDFILGEEVPPLLERRQNEGVRVIPVIVKPCVWQAVNWLKPIQVRPKDGKPISSMRGHRLDRALAELAKEIMDITKPAGEMVRTKKGPSIPPEHIFTAKLPTTGHELFGREKELATLDEAWKDAHTNILSLVAWGGVGKTALVNYWLNQMECDNWREAESVFGWSFYSQGTREDRQASGDEFLAYAIKWFGDEDMANSKSSPWDKGVRLAELIRRQKTLLILDGLEPLQYPPGPMEGRLKDQGLQALLKELVRSNPGLCIITTREKVKDIEHAEGSTLKCIFLENLSVEAGVELLKSLGVKGTDKELRKAVEDFGGHALALNLLGTYLTTVHEGEIRKRDLVPRLTDEQEQGGHAKRVMESYEIWLKGTPELDILYLMGLFDRPAPGGAIDELRKEPAIKELTDKLQGLSDANWQYAVKHLRDLRLLGQRDDLDPDKLDCHPLVREHFGQKLKENNPEGCAKRTADCMSITRGFLRSYMASFCRIRCKRWSRCLRRSLTAVWQDDIRKHMMLYIRIEFKE